LKMSVNQSGRKQRTPLVPLIPARGVNLRAPVKGVESGH
jgi:hypothetical protein